MTLTEAMANIALLDDPVEAPKDPEIPAFLPYEFSRLRALEVHRGGSFGLAWTGHAVQRMG